jgi:predicted dehydrogenase/threonine dehydrogenase-like Zn-dependent dehydrogenase
MKQLLQNMKTGKTSVEDVPVPSPLPGMALVKTEASLVSAGTERMLVEFAEKNLLGKARSRPDLVRQVLDKARREGLMPTVQAAFKRLDQPMPLGYSLAGTIVELADGMDGFTVGQRVACAGANYAVHAEYAIVPRNLITPLPKDVDFESAAFTTLGAIALQGFRLAEPQLGESVAVIGMGLLGLLTGQIAAAAGCRVLGIEINPARIELAASLGLQACPRDQAESTAQAFTANRGFDSVIICADAASNDPVELAGTIARDKGRVVATGAVGLNIPRNIYFKKELSFINSRSYGPGRYDPVYEEAGVDYPIGYVRWTEGRNLEAIVELMAAGKVDVKSLISHRFPIEEAVRAYDIITGKRAEPFLGVILTYPSAKTDIPRKRIEFRTPTILGTPHVALGVMGAGLFANATLLPSLKKVDGIELIGIASAGGLRAQHAAKKFGFVYAASSEDEIMDNPDINTVAILTRHNTHAEFVVKALKAGKHVFVEKPLALNSDQLAAISDQLGTSSSLLTVGFNRRFAPLAKTLSSRLADRTEPLYAHYRINAGHIPLDHWTQDPAIGGGRLIGEGCHFIDFITFLVGAPPVSINAVALPDNGVYREDNLSMTFTFPEGSIGVVDYLANGDKSFPKERVEVFCGGQIAVLDDFRRLEMVKNSRRQVLKSAQDKGWKNEWVAFASAIRGGSGPPIPYDQLFSVTKGSFAAVESIRQKGKQVEIR